MARPENNPFDWNELIQKREEVFKLYLDNNIIIDSLNIDSTFSFGKFKGENIFETIEKHPEYIEWLIDSTDDKCLDFNTKYFSIYESINKQHIQLNAIKFEISQLQKISEWNPNVAIPEIPNYYKFIC